MFTYATPATPGPLTTLAISMFGNQSYFEVARNSTPDTAGQAMFQICQPGTLPFSRLIQSEYGGTDPTPCGFSEGWTRNGDGPTNDNLRQLLLWSFAPLNNTNFASQMLETGAFFANRAVLRQTADATASTNARTIWSGSGEMILKPVVTNTGIGIISGFLLLQMLSIAILVLYIYHVPTWTDSLDALAIAKLMASLDTDDFGPMGPRDNRDIRALEKINGLVGVEDEEELGQTGRIRLGMGAAGVIRRSLGASRLRRKVNTGRMGLRGRALRRKDETVEGN